MPRRLNVVDHLARRLEGEHWLFPATVCGGAALYVILTVILSVAARAHPFTLFGDPFVVLTGALAFGAFWGGAGILAAMGFPRVLLFATLANCAAYLTLIVRASRGPPFLGEDVALAVVWVFTAIAMGVLGGAITEGAALWERHREARKAEAQATHDAP